MLNYALHNKSNSNFKIIMGISRWEEVSKRESYNIDRSIQALHP
jgi:hypothetical protein|tara:strand:+ start:65 stop:196 length:132 start_codon:yes stop_codon:yes gene_type:complete